jgi:hypothetical protein
MMKMESSELHIVADFPINAHGRLPTMTIEEN